MSDAPAVAEHFFRREHAKLVASLSRRVGVAHLDRVEDAAQAALTTALEVWPRTGTPDHPSAWLYTVARNALLGGLRTETRRAAQARADQPPRSALPPEVPLAGEVQDDLLRMLLVCCDERIPADSRVVLALKTLCGFSVGEIAERLFTTEANVYKRLSRARARLRQGGALDLDLDLPAAQLAPRVGGVHRVLYLLFTEGHLSARTGPGAAALRRELCAEAIRLAELLAAHPAGATPSTHALLALLYLQGARLPARLDARGALVLLEEQDRSRWDRRWIAQGMQWLARSAEGPALSRYHAEAGIAAEHCLAPSFAETRWPRIVELYALLERAAPSPLHRLNRALALAEWRGPEVGLAVLEEQAPPGWLAGSYLWTAALADLHHRAGHVGRAAALRARALEDAPTDAVRASLQRRWAAPGGEAPGSG